MKKRSIYMQVASLGLVMGLIAIAPPLPVFADVTDATWDPENYAWAERAFAVQYPRTTPQGHLILSIDHRASQPLDEKPFSSLLGFDSGNLKIGLGVWYGLLDNIDIGVKRYNGTDTPFDTYEFVSRVRVLNEARGLADLALGGGFTWFDAETGNDKYGGMAEILLGRTLLKRLYVTTGAMYHSRPPVMTGTADVPNYSVAMLASANLQLIDRLAMVTEWSIPVAGVWEGAPAWAAGFKFYTLKHTFALLVSNTHNYSDDRLVAGAIEWGHPVFGFAITRQL